MNGMMDREIDTLLVIRKLRERSGCGRVRVSDIAKMLEIPAPGVSRMLRNLEQRGWIVRETDPEDRRITLVRITPQGEKVLDAKRKAFDAFLDELTDRIGHEKIQELIRMNNEMYQEAERLIEEHFRNGCCGYAPQDSLDAGDGQAKQGKQINEDSKSAPDEDNLAEPVESKRRNG